MTLTSSDCDQSYVNISNNDDNSKNKKKHERIVEMHTILEQNTMDDIDQTITVDYDDENHSDDGFLLKHNKHEQNHENKQYEQQQLSDYKDMESESENVNVNDNDNDNDNANENEISDQFFSFKQHVKNKRQSTFCCIFSCGSLILAVVLLLAALSTQMMDDYKLYKGSTHTQCKIVNITYLNGTVYHDPPSNISTISDHQIQSDQDILCKYSYSTTDGHDFNDKCKDEMYEQQSCFISTHHERYRVGYSDGCYFFNDNTCNGTMINSVNLLRNYNMFILLLAVGSLFAILTIGSSISAFRLVMKSGIYCSVMSLQNDDEKLFDLMDKFQRQHANSIHTMEENTPRHQHRHRHDQEKEKVEEMEMDISLQFGSSIINSMASSTIHSSTINSSTNSLRIIDND